jgi:transcriptional regulator with XRE-family HTH domain
VADVDETDIGADRTLPPLDAALVELGRTVTARRRELGLTQAQLAARCGLPQPEISKVETAKANPTAATLCKLAEPLGLTLRLVVADDPGAAVSAPTRDREVRR